MCMIDDAEPWDFYKAETRHARKQHTCDECRRTIEPGEEYENARGGYGNDIDVFKTCRHCIAARQWLVKVCSGFPHTMVMEDLKEHFDEGYNPRWLALAVSGMRHQWRDKNGNLRRPMSLPKNLPLGA